MHHQSRTNPEYEQFGKECGISSPTVKTWLSALENSVIFLLQPITETSANVLQIPALFSRHGIVVPFA